MEALLVQDFITARGTQLTTVVQPRYGWVDLGDIEDVILYVDVREATNAPTLTFQTAPAAVDNAFITLGTPVTLSGTGLTTTSLLARLAGVPPARFLRWMLSGSAGTWDATFRIWAAGYGLG